MLVFMIFAMLCLPVSAGDATVEVPLAAMRSAMAVDRLRAWLRRCRNRITDRQWHSAGLMPCKVPKKPESAKKRARATPPCNNNADPVKTEWFVGTCRAQYNEKKEDYQGLHGVYFGRKTLFYTNINLRHDPTIVTKGTNRFSLLDRKERRRKKIGLCITGNPPVNI